MLLDPIVKVTGSLVVAVVVVKIPLLVVEEDQEVLMLEEEMVVDQDHLVQSQMVAMHYKTLAEVVEDQDLLMETTMEVYQVLGVPVLSLLHILPK